MNWSDSEINASREAEDNRQIETGAVENEPDCQLCGEPETYCTCDDYDANAEREFKECYFEEWH